MYDELSSVLKKAKNGSKDAKAQIVERYIKYVYSRASRYRLSCMDMDDLVSEGRLTILNCIDKYDPKKSGNFTSYVTRAVSNNLMDMKIKDYKRTFLNTSPGYDIMSSIPSDEDITSSADKIALMNAIRKLPPSDCQLITAIYYKHMSLKDAACEFGVSYVTICNRRRSAIRRLALLMK